MLELHRIKQAPILCEVAQGGPTRFGEVSARPSFIGSQLHQAPLEHGTDGGWHLGLSGGWTTAPCAQKYAVRHGRVLAELHAEGSPDQIAFRRGEQKGRGVGGGRHGGSLTRGRCFGRQHDGRHPRKSPKSARTQLSGLWAARPAVTILRPLAWG